jgi:hypothetical protein
MEFRWKKQKVHAIWMWNSPSGRPPDGPKWGDSMILLTVFKRFYVKFMTE